MLFKSYTAGWALRGLTAKVMYFDSTSQTVSVPSITSTDNTTVTSLYVSHDSNSTTTPPLLALCPFTRFNGCVVSDSDFSSTDTSMTGVSDLTASYSATSSVTSTNATLTYTVTIANTASESKSFKLIKFSKNVHTEKTTQKTFLCHAIDMEGSISVPANDSVTYSITINL